VSPFNRDIEKLITEIENRITHLKKNKPRFSADLKHYARRMDFFQKKFEKIDFNELLLRDLLVDVKPIKNICSYCKKPIPPGKDICPWCGHQKEDDDRGFFPYLYYPKPPGGASGTLKRKIIAPIIQF
jgi:hypothetical protein